MIEQVAEICERAKAGDVAAASELVGLFYERVFCYFRRLCGNDPDAEDDKDDRDNEPFKSMQVACILVKYIFQRGLRW